MSSTRNPSHRRRNRLALATLAVAVSMSLAATSAMAQESSEQAQPEQSATTLDTIQVTAQFRTQNVQKTPLAITAMNAQMLDARGQLSVLDVASASPNVNIKPAAGNYGSAAAVYIRGVGQYDSSFALEPGVGVYIDDVYHSTLIGSVFDLLDLERVEILRGPQGTLAGKNSIGGAVKLYSRVPDQYSGGSFQATVGSFGRRDIRASGNFVLSEDRAFLRLAGVSKQRDGHVTRYDYGCLNPTSGIPATMSRGDCVTGTEGGENFQGVRASLQWKPTDKVEVNIIADASNQDGDPPATIGLVGPDARFLTPGTYITYSDYRGNGNGNRWNSSDISKLEAKGLSAKVDWTISDNSQLTSITAFREYDSQYGVDMDRGPFGYYTQDWYSSNETFSQEVRLNSSAVDGRLEYTVGAYYFDSSSRLEGLADIPRLYAYHNDPVEAKSASAFVHTMFALTDKWELSAGARFTDEEKTYTFVRINPVTGQPNDATHGQVSHYSGDRLDYRLAASYQINDNTLAYASYSTGFKGGGVNPRPFVVSQVAPFNPEILKAFEVGLKADLFDRSLRLNSSVFFNDYTDILMTITNGYGGFPVSAIPLNAGEAEVRGAEIELTAYPIEGLAIDASLGYLDFEYKKLSEAALASRMSYGMVAPYMSKHKGSLGIQYDIVGERGTLTPRFDASYYSDFYTNANNTAVGKVDGQTISNARLTWRPHDGNWEAAIGVTNLSDAYYYLNKIDVSSASGVANANPGRPREWFASIKYEF